jgi:hypothetical protein
VSPCDAAPDVAFVNLISLLSDFARGRTRLQSLPSPYAVEPHGSTSYGSCRLGILDQLENRYPPPESTRIELRPADDLGDVPRFVERKCLGKKAKCVRGFVEPCSQPTPGHGDDFRMIERQGRQRVRGKLPDIGRIRSRFRLQAFGANQRVIGDGN